MGDAFIKIQLKQLKIKTIKDLSNNYNLYIVSNYQSGYIEAFLEHYSIDR